MARLDEDKVRELWEKYKYQGDKAARDRLILAYSPLVKYVAGRMSNGLPSHIEESDLISYGLLGPHRRSGAVRSVARDQVRDLRHLAHQGLHHRRAALPGLGAAFGAQQGA